MKHAKKEHLDLFFGFWITLFVSCMFLGMHAALNMFVNSPKWNSPEWKQYQIAVAQAKYEDAHEYIQYMSPEEKQELRKELGVEED